MGTPAAGNEGRDALLAEIREAFKDITRKGGVSWSQAYVHDVDYVERADIPDDPDRHWSELVGNKEWRIDPGLGGFCFLDPIGFRYDMAAAMCRLVENPESGELSFFFRIEPNDAETWHIEKWSEFSDRQRRTVARFLAFMHRHRWPTEDIPPDEVDHPEYQFFYPHGHALNLYWKQFLEP